MAAHAASPSRAGVRSLPCPNLGNALRAESIYDADMCPGATGGAALLRGTSTKRARKPAPDR